MNPSPAEDLHAAFLELTASLHSLRGALAEFQHGLVEAQVEAQIGSGDEAACDAMAAARHAIDRALGAR